MKQIVLTIITSLMVLTLRADAYVDHRGHPVDSLERVVAVWTPQMIDSASDEELKELVLNWKELMLGFLQINGTKSEYYARRILNISVPKKWYVSQFDAYKVIGQTFWAQEHYDSASVYFKLGLDAVSNMDDDTPQKVKDDLRSSLYGAIGNLYSMQDSIDVAMGYYERAGEIFKKYNWLNSCSVLYYNMGETWGEAGQLDKAKDCYEESLRYAHEANDSLWIASALKGLGALYLTKGETYKALNALKQADDYFSLHEDEELLARLETVDYIGQVLELQKRRLRLELLALAVIALLAGVVVYVVLRLRKTRQEKAEVTELLEETISETPHLQDIKLNDREQAILKMLSEGKETAEMADHLCLSNETIKWYRKRLLAKFDVASAPALVAEAYKKGLIRYQ